MVAKYIFFLFSICPLSIIYLVWLNQFFNVGPMNILNWIILCCGGWGVRACMHAVLCIVGCFVTSLASPHQMPVKHAPPHINCDKQKCPQTLPIVPWGLQNYPQLRTMGLISKGASYRNYSNSLASATIFFSWNFSSCP